MRLLLSLVGCGLLAILSAWCASDSALLRAQTGTASRKLAFLVGVKNYDHAQLKALDYPERDVEEFAKLLRSAGYTVVLMTTAVGEQTPALLPTAENIQTQLDKLLTKATRRDMILVGLAGHGIQPLGSDSAYFCPQDANPTIVSGTNNQPSRPKLPETLLGIDDLLQKLDDSGIGRKLVLMDACRNDPGVRGRRGIDRVKVAALPQETGILLSCSPGEFAFEHKNFGGGHGAFFHHVIEGFKGRARDEEEDGVTWESLVKYVGKRVPTLVESQYGADGGQQHPNLIANLRIEAVLLAKGSVTPEKIESFKPTIQVRPKPGEMASPKNLANSAAPPVSKHLDVRPLDKPWSETLNENEWSTNGPKMKFCRCPPGTFTMGSAGKETSKSDERQVQVTLTSGFWMGKYEVTEGQWRSVMGVGAPEFRAKAQSPNEPIKPLTLAGEETWNPMRFVNYADAKQFCDEFTRQEQQAGRLSDDWEFRLPTEAEWEYACRAGTMTATTFGNELTTFQANINGPPPEENSDRQPGPMTVGSYHPNAWGLCDMHGNVQEWCRDYYLADLPGGTDPVVTRPSSYRVLRGGSYLLNAGSCRSASRSGTKSDLRGWESGFRVVAAKVKK